MLNSSRSATAMIHLSIRLPALETRLQCRLLESIPRRTLDTALLWLRGFRLTYTQEESARVQRVQRGLAPSPVIQSRTKSFL